MYFRLSLLIVMGMLVPVSLLACDFCSHYTGVLPQDKMNRLEFTHRYSRFSHFMPATAGGTTTASHHRIAHSPESSVPLPLDKTELETFRFVEMRYTVFPLPAWQFSLNLPWQQYRSFDGTTTRERTGFGDLTAIAQYGIRLRDEPSRSLRWFAGGGARIPTGWYYRNPDRYADYFFEQGGRGSAGILLITTLNLRMGNFGTSSFVNWNWLAPRSFQYRPGSVLNFNQYFFWLVNFKSSKVRLVPAANVYMEYMEANVYRDHTVSNTGGVSILTGPDVSLYLNRWMIRSGCQFPVMEKLYGKQPENVWRWQISLGWNFGKL